VLIDFDSTEKKEKDKPQNETVRKGNMKENPCYKAEQEIKRQETGKQGNRGRVDGSSREM
jgi:hypothetical protein